MQPQEQRILADLNAHLRSKGRRWMLGGLIATSLLGVVAATAVVPGAIQPPFPLQTVVEQLGAPSAAAPAGDALPFIHDERIRPGDTIQGILARIGANDGEALAYLHGNEQGRLALRQLRAGRSVLAAVDAGGRVLSLSLPVTGSAGRFSMERTDTGFRTRSEAAEAPVAIVEMRSATISHSLYGATDAIGLPDSIANKLVEIFSTEIDFHTDLRKGDRFSVVYETEFEDGVPVRARRVLAAEFINQGKRHVVVLFRGADGREQYYTADGRSLRAAFLRSPLEFSRVTSSFGRRLHPIHKQWRTHAGVDFGAPTGTPVKATSDGTVAFVGRQNGYGNIVVLRHRDRYSTAYAHLNGFARGLHKGDRVSQGDLIGYVGMTGWATGPHLHYEVRVNDVPHDPMAIALPKVQPLDRKELALFRQQTEPMTERLALLDQDRMASAD